MKFPKYTLLFAFLSAPVLALSPAGRLSNPDFILSPEEEPVPQVTTVTGQVTQTDDVKEFFQLQDQVGKVHSFRVATQTTPIIDPRYGQISFYDLKPGDRLAVRYSVTDDNVQGIQRIPAEDTGS